MGKNKFKLEKPQREKKISTAVPSSSAPPPPWAELPRDVAANILQRLSCVELLENVQKVCTTWRSLCQDPSMWRVIDLRNIDDMFDDPEIICRHLVNRSQGQLMEISIEYFGTDDLLHYISESFGFGISLCDELVESLTRAICKGLKLVDAEGLSCMHTVDLSRTEVGKLAVHF